MVIIRTNQYIKKHHEINHEHTIQDGRPDRKQEREKTEDKEQVAEKRMQESGMDMGYGHGQSCRDNNRIVLSPELLNLALQMSRIGQPSTHPLFYTW